MENLEALIHDWNVAGEKPQRPSTKKVEFDDETLRDGLQSPSVTDPSIEEKIEILHLMASLGIDSLNLGLPGAGHRAVSDVTALANQSVRAKLKLRANCAARTHQ